MKLHHDGMLELEHEVIAKNDPVVVKLGDDQNFGSGTSLGYGFRSGPVSTNLGAVTIQTLTIRNQMKDHEHDETS